MKISQDYAESEQSGHSGTRFHGEWMGENLYGSYNIKLNGSYPVVNLSEKNNNIFLYINLI